MGKNNRERAFTISSVAGTRGHQMRRVQKKKNQTKKDLCTECAIELRCFTGVIMTVCTLSKQGFKKELHKFREEKSTGAYCLWMPRKLLNLLSLDIRKVFKRNMPLSSTSGIGHCWRQDVRLCQSLILMFFPSFLSPFCLQHTTNYPSGTVMTQLQMLLYSHHHHHDDPDNC